MTDKRKRGRPSDAVVVAKAEKAMTVAEQMERTTLAIFRRIERLAEEGRDIPISLLGAGRMCAEWHTDYLTVTSATTNPNAAAASDEEG